MSSHLKHYVKTKHQNCSINAVPPFTSVFVLISADGSAICSLSGRAVTQLIEALRYVPEGGEFDSLWPCVCLSL
jgi:hypothetical protein